MMDRKEQALPKPPEPGNTETNETSDEMLDEDQQKAFDSILSQIQESGVETVEPEAESRSQGGRRSGAQG